MKSIQILAILVFICSTGKSQTQLWLEDFNLIGEGDMCGTGIVYAPDSNFTIQCGAGSDFIGAFIVADSIPFIFDDSEGVELETPIISISNFVASISLEISGTSSLDPTDSFSLYTNIDGTGYNLKAVRSDESDLNDIYINALTGSTLQVKVVVFNVHDLAWAEQHAAQVREECMLYLQPEWDKREAMMPLIVDHVLKHPRWRISLQTHKYLNIP